MKKYLVGLLILPFTVSVAEAKHRFIFGDAANISTGTLSNERLDGSSVTLQGNTISISTIASGLQSLKDSVSSTQTAFYNYTSTADALITKGLNSGATTSTRIDELQADLSTHSVRIDELQADLSTHSVRIDELQADLSTTSVDIDNLYIGANSTYTAFRNYSSTADSRMDAIRTDTTTLNNRFLNGAITINDEGSSQGNATAIDFAGAGVSLTCSGSTCTASISGGGAAAFQKPATIVLGTASAQNVDIVSTNHEGFLAAVTTVSERGGGSIYVREGRYELFSTVIVPSNVVVYADRGAILQNREGSVQNCIHIRGEWIGGTFNPHGMATAATGFIRVEGERAVLRDFIVVDSTNQANAYHSIVILDGNNPTVRNGIFHQINLTGAQSTIVSARLNRTKGALIEGCIFRNIAGAGVGYVHLAGTNNVTIRNCRFEFNTGAPQGVLSIHDSSNAVIANNYFDLQSQNGVSAVFAQTQGGTTYSFATQYINNYFVGGTNVLYLASFNTDGFATNNIISGNTFINPTTAAIKFERSTSGTIVNTFIHGNNMQNGTFTSFDASDTNTKSRDNMTNATLATDS